jgi:hypothetical protein
MVRRARAPYKEESTMRKIFVVRSRTLAIRVLSVAAVWLVTFAGAALADPPMRVGRLSLAEGPVSFAPAGDDVWIEGRINRPLTIGDRLWTADNARAEVELGGASIRMSDRTSVSVLNLDDRIVQVQLAQGRVNVRVRALPRGETFEIATPNTAFTIDRPGDYRIDVDPQADATTIAIRNGAGNAYGDGAAFALRAGETVRFYGTDLSQREFYALAPADGFDRWARERDRRFERAYASRYVSPEIVGYGDLEVYGSWRNAEGFGNVWFPREVPQGWAPYRYGHWSWIDPWGWTWVDDAAWGFAPFHYGRWAYVGDTWGWVPGPAQVRPVYAPALVAFVGGANFQISIRSGPIDGGIGWFPLAPGEVYRPAYVASRDYVRNVNISNTIVNTTVINNVYNNNNVTQVNYRNAQVANAVTAVPPAVFAQSQPVQRNAVPVSRDALIRGQVTPVATVAPTRTSITGAAATTNNRPAAEVLQRSVVARSAPPAPVAPAAQRMEMMQRDPGKPLERPAIPVQPGVATAAPNVRVVNNAPPQTLPQRGRDGAQAMTPPPATAQPPVARIGRENIQNGAPPADRGRGATQVPPAAPPAQMTEGPRGMQSPSAPPPGAAAPQPPLRRDQRNADDQQRPANAPVPVPPQAVAPPVASPPMAQPPMTPPQRAGARDQGDVQRNVAPPPVVQAPRGVERPNAPPPAPPQGIVQPPRPAAAPPVAAAPAPQPAPPESRRGNEGNAAPLVRQRETPPAPQAAQQPQARAYAPPQAQQAPQPAPPPPARTVPPQAQSAPQPAPPPQARAVPPPQPQQAPQPAPPPQARGAPPPQPQAQQPAPPPAPDAIAPRQRGQGDPNAKEKDRERGNN